jgi:hypothetical protein
MYVLHIETILDIDLFRRLVRLVDEFCLHAYSHHRESSTRAVTSCLLDDLRMGDAGVLLTLSSV